MFVCICKAVSDKAIKQAIAEGADSIRDLKARLGVGSQCGKCVCQASQILHNELVKQHQLIDKLAKPAA
ncbi:bacterioferritin-associated ferredoxin [Alishewanella tabrizica]|uniref:Bacterioferritin-associated ferredoxin n=1 Tax=Alishewanella tabrizica TaxID=671278 RepID=A0ABQ2WMR2_9ALTE|nr:bacterioferritin-associated ferredoxin [Alishewanella tabrizica]GGW59606.1 (2Fe-2S)-binding protein [Alishewanella tabrizica]